MWLQTNIGFYSIVSKPEDQETGQLTIRARIKSDLLALKNLYLPTLGAITESTKTDYRYRSKVSRTDLAQAMTNMIGTIGYGNFKNEIAAVQGKQRSNLYGRVWSNLYELDLEPEEFDWDSTAAIDKMTVPAADAYGVMLVSPNGQTLLRRVSGAFDGYVWTFAKGKPDGYEPPQQTAKRECLEETGIWSRLIGLLPQRYQGTTGSTVFFVGVTDGEPQPFGPETSQIRWATIQEAHELVSLTTNTIGRDRDQTVLCDLYRWLCARQNH